MVGEGRWRKKGWCRGGKRIGFDKSSGQVQLLPRSDPEQALTRAITRRAVGCLRRSRNYETTGNFMPAKREENLGQLVKDVYLYNISYSSTTAMTTTSFGRR